MKRVIVFLMVCFMFSHSIHAETKYEVACSYIGKNMNELIEVIGNPLKYEVTPDCLGKGKDALYQYDGFSVYATGENEYQIVSVRKDKKVTKSASYSNASISGKNRIEGLWKKRNGYVYYKNDKGIKQMGDKTYFFDQNGRQKTGWIKIGRYYYFFRIANGATGYMLKSCRINGMIIDQKGRAHGDRAKLKVLSLASNYVHRYTKPLLSRDKRYQLCYKKVINTFHYGGSHTFKGGNWSVYYADRMLKRHKEVCWGFAGALAYMANACGYQNVKVQATKKHGWANVNGKIVDGSYGASHKSLKWFMFDASAKGRIFPATVYKHPEFSVKV